MSKGLHRTGEDGSIGGWLRRVVDGSRKERRGDETEGETGLSGKNGKGRPGSTGVTSDGR